MVEDVKLLETNLISALQAGDEQAFTAIYDKYWKKMYLVAYRKLQHKEIAEEIVQDIFTNLWKKRSEVKIQNLEFYLFSAVKFEVVDNIRIRSSQTKYLEYYKQFVPFEDCNTENTIAFNDLITTIDQGLEILPDKTKEIFKLHRLQHWPIDELARHFDISERAVEYHLTRASKSLRIYLGGTLLVILLSLSSFLLNGFLV